MKEYKGIISVLLCVIMVVAAIRVGLGPEPDAVVDTHEYNDSIVVWYTDDTMTDYLNAMAVEYHENGGMRVLPRLHSSNDYVEAVYKASIEDDGAPDLYIVSNDALEKAYLSGCAVAVDEEWNVLNPDNFPGAALNAVTYKGHRVAYPYYFETSVLLYNKTYLHDMILGKLKSEAEAESSEGSSDEGENAEGEEEDSANNGAELEKLTREKMETSIPKTFDELLAFADEYDAPENVEGIFKWDVRDVFFNYFFIGNYINVGGECGDDSESVDVYNQDAIKALTLFQRLNSFFAFESSDVTYDQVVQEFIEGKLVFATATSDIVSRLDAASEAGEFEYEYGLAIIPDLSDEMDTRSLSVTEAVVVNGYSKKMAEAENFAKFLTLEKADGLYDKTGKLPSARVTLSENEELIPKLKAFTDEYSYSRPMPKLMTTANYWLLLEDAFSRVWSGKDASKTLKELAEKLHVQITGQTVSFDYITLPAETEEEEYLDEEALKQAAQDDEKSEQ